MPISLDSFCKSKADFSHARKLSCLTNDERYHIHTSKESGEAKARIGKFLPSRDDRTRAAYAVRNVLKYRRLLGAQSFFIPSRVRKTANFPRSDHHFAAQAVPRPQPIAHVRTTAQLALAAQRRRNRTYCFCSDVARLHNPCGPADGHPEWSAARRAGQQPIKIVWRKRLDEIRLASSGGNGYDFDGERAPQRDLSEDVTVKQTLGTPAP